MRSVLVGRAYSRAGSRGLSPHRNCKLYHHTKNREGWFDGLLARRGPLLHPLPILLVRRISDDKSIALLFRPVHPPVGFGMAVRKGEAATAVVVGPGRVKPFGGFHPKGKSRVIEAFGVFVQQHPEPGRSRSVNIG